MTNWIDVVKAETIAPGNYYTTNIASINIVIFNLAGDYYAVENVCTHDGGALAGGPIIGDEIVCPRHGARFCIKTGAVTQPPAYEDIRTFPVRIINDILQIQIS